MARDKETTYRVMSAVKSKNTVPERLLGRAMWKVGLRYRKHHKVDGRPDFAFVSAKVAVFCDGDFWHGNNWRLRGIPSLKEELASYAPYWAEKIQRNVARDRRVDQTLRDAGWTVLRFWESDIRVDPEKTAREILNVLREKRGEAAAINDENTPYPTGQE